MHRFPYLKVSYFVNVTKYYESDCVDKVEMGGSCSSMRHEKYIQNFGQKTSKDETAWKN